MEWDNLLQKAIFRASIKQNLTGDQLAGVSGKFGLQTCSPNNQEP